MRAPYFNCISFLFVFNKTKTNLAVMIMLSYSKLSLICRANYIIKANMHGLYFEAK